jgi:hypothetical protein
MGHSAVIVDESVLAFLTELEVQKSLRLQYPISLLILRAEAEARQAIPDPGHLAQQLGPAVSRVIRGTDAVAPSSTSPLLEILLVNADADALAGILGRIREEVSRHRFQLNGERAALTLRIGTACFPRTAATAAELRAQATREASREDGEENQQEP